MPTNSILVGLVGAGIQASLTPRLHEDEGAAQGLRYQYRLIDLDVLGLMPPALPEILAKAERDGFTGLNITYPCKQAVIALLDELSPDARAIGAVNTVIFREGRRFGHNTDWTGFFESFRRTLSEAGRDRVVQFGAGGAGAAVADAVAAADGLVNTTPVGMAKLPGSVVPERWLRPELWVADIVYFPLETELLRAAGKLGCRTMSGAGMAVFQAAGAFELFSGLAPDVERMLGHFERMAAGL